MKILCVYPWLDPEFSSAAEAILELGRRGHEVVALSVRRASSYKGEMEFAAKSEYPGVTFHRPLLSLKEQFGASKDAIDKARACLTGFVPDIVFCSLQHNMKMSEALARDFDVPIVLLVEFARDPANLLPLRGMGRLRQLRLDWLMTPAARVYWWRLARRTEAIIVTNPVDRPHLEGMTLSGKEVQYVPWCNQLPEMDEVERIPNTGIHVGGLNRFKNSGELAQSIRVLLEETPTEHFTVIGPGPCAASIKRLAQDCSEGVTYIESLPRRKALELMAQADYAFLTAKQGALGFIGDSWGLQLPLVSLHNPSGLLEPGEDSFVSGGIDRLADSVNRMLADQRLRDRIARGGHERYLAENTAAVVATRYEELFQRVIERALSRKRTLNYGY